MVIYNKVIRDKIPEIIKNSGNSSVVKNLSDEKFLVELEKKLKEEVEELYHLIVTSSEMLKMLKTLVEQVKVLVSVCEDRIASLNDDEVTIGDDLKDQIAHFTSIQSNAQNALKEITFKKTFQYDGLGSTLVFAESLGFVDNSPSSNAEGWNPDEADGLEDSAIEFIESKGYKIVGYPEEDQS